jgi:calcineurin-like phosphoesterase family protein
MTIFHRSDDHFGHKNIIGYSGRPWADVDAMNQGLVDRHNELVSEDDTVWFHGDVALSLSQLHWASQMNGTKYLLAGNHDKCWTHAKKGGRPQDIQPYIDAGFEKVYTSGILYNYDMGAQKVTLSHLPYAGDHTETDRYIEFRPENRGQVNLCGHVHEKWKVWGRSINVGVDVWDWYPVPEDNLIDMIKAGLTDDPHNGKIVTPVV